MKKSALFILFALISVAGFSQITGWNAKVGMNISNYTGDADLNAKIGFKLGGGFEYAFDNTWSLQPSLFLSTKGAKKDGNSINAMYLELPVMAAARFNVADNTNIVVNAGPYLACGIAGKTKIDLGNDTERKYDTFGDDALKRFDAGLGVGVALELGEKIIKQGNLPGVLGEKHASGTEIIKELGEEHLKTGKPIIYTSADSVLQIAAHEEVFGLERLYELCKICYELVKPYHIARVIARPFVGTRAEDFVRTGNRHDYAVPAPADTLLDKLVAAGGSVYAVGKIADIFAHRGITKHYPASGLDKLFAAALQAVQEAPDNSLVFVNFVDFDSSFGHRRDVEGYGEGLEYFDDRLPELLRLLKQDDLLLVTADHGCDPTWSGSDHTREKIPVLFFGKNIVSKALLPMRTFSDIGQTIAVHLGIERLANGKAAELR